MSQHACAASDAADVLGRPMMLGAFGLNETRLHASASDAVDALGDAQRRAFHYVAGID